MTIMMHDSWDMEHNGQNICHFGSFFAILLSPTTCPLLTTQKIKILKKWKKTPANIIILHMCTRNGNHMIYGSWDMEHNRKSYILRWVSHLKISDKEYEHVLNVWHKFENHERLSQFVFKMWHFTVSICFWKILNTLKNYGLCPSH